MGVKIATCCYCGTKAALALRGKHQHELSCSNCGAPLHEMKMMPIHPAKPVKSAPHRPVKSKKKRKIKRRPPIHRRIFAEIIDEIEDLFD